MQIFTLSTTNCFPLTSNYYLDSTVKFKEQLIFTENDVTFPLNDALKEANDTATNNFSNLYLGRKSSLTNNIFIENLDKLPDEGFRTYLAVNALLGVNSLSRFWVVEEPQDVTINSTIVAVSGLYVNLDNRYYFEIVFLDDLLCKIAHENNGIKRYLTLDLNSGLTFCKDLNDDYLGMYSPQIFTYIYDRDNDYIVFQKNTNDVVKYLSISPDPLITNLILVDSLTASSIAFNSSAIFKCSPRTDEPNTTILIDPWVSYDRNFYNNEPVINPDRSYDATDDSYLLNNEYFNISGNELNLNFLTLKNTNTPENYQARSNPFFNERPVEMRDYKKIFSGSNQTYGNDNILLGYEGYTSNIIFKNDKVTYFHIPQNFYPFKQLNINDSGLIEAGAMAGDHPLKSDKVFKKKADYEKTSIFGNTLEETTGDFLCAWLSGNPDVTAKPVWVDRYYNPSKLTFIDALTSSTFQSINYVSLYECLMKNANIDFEVFDKPSDLIFEKGTYYAYQRLGAQYSRDYLNVLNDVLVQKNFDIYRTTNQANIAQPLVSNPEYIFDGSAYAVTNNLSAIDATNSFTIVMDIANKDWTKPFAYQMIGNYSNDGFGVFNMNHLTPTLFIPSENTLYITNTDFTSLNTIVFNSNIEFIIRFDGFDYYHVMLADGTFKRLNNKNIEMYSITNAAFSNIIDYDYDSINAYFLVYAGAGNKLYRLNLITGVLKEFTASEYDYNVKLSYNTNNHQLQPANTLDVVDGVVYLTDGIKSKRTGTNIYYGTGSLITLWRDIKQSIPTLLPRYFSLALKDFNVDVDGNIWILYDDNTYAKFTSSQVLTLSGQIDGNSIINTVDFIYELGENEVKEYTIISSISSYNSTQTILFHKYDNQTNLLSSFSYPIQSLNLPITPINYIREYLYDLYPDSNLNYRIKLTNTQDDTDVEDVNLIFNLSSLDAGYHNFAFRVDTYRGEMQLIIDGHVVKQQTFQPRMYQFSDLITRPFFIGTSPYTNGIPMFEYLKTNKFNAKNITVKNFYLYSTPLNYFDIMFHKKMDKDSLQDVVFNVACGKRGYLEEIERYFKFTLPGHKSTAMNVVLRNSGIYNPELQLEIEKRILLVLKNSIPAYAKINSIKWSN